MPPVETPEFEEAETTLDQLSSEVEAAEKELVAELLKKPEPPPTPTDLQKNIENSWTASVVSIAFWRLVNSGRFIVDESLRVHPGDIEGVEASTPTASSP